MRARQSTVYTAPYPTQLLGGRYCMPVDPGLRSSLLYGPLNPAARLWGGIGSFQDCWLALFISVLISLVLGFAFIFLMKVCGKCLLYFTVGFTTFAYLFAGLYFLAAVIALIPHVENALAMFKGYKETQPIFVRNTPFVAAILSIVMGAFFLLCSISSAATLVHIEAQHHKIEDLLEVVHDCVFSMQQLFIPPIVDAFWKLFILWWICTNFMYLVSVGSIDERRVDVNGLHYLGPSKKFNLDVGMTPWIIIYVYGALWWYELSVAMLQFIVAYATVLWYYVEKVDGEKQTAPRHPAIFAAMVAVRYHLGSLIFGAAVMPLLRIVRVTDYLLWGNLPKEGEAPAPPFHWCGCLCGLVGKCCRPIQGCFDVSDEGIFGKWTKNAYIDVILRSNHFLPCAERSAAVTRSHHHVTHYMGSLRIYHSGSRQHRHDRHDHYMGYVHGSGAV